jgi:hypothetical protein
MQNIEGKLFVTHSALHYEQKATKELLSTC